MNTDMSAYAEHQDDSDMMGALAALDTAGASLTAGR